MCAMEGAPDLENLTEEEWKQIGLTPDEFRANIARMEERERSAPKVGDIAPDFDIKRLGKGGTPTGERVRLSDFRGKSVALILGSYT